MRALLAEDDPAIARAIAGRLRDGGHVVDTVETGRLADEALTTTPFELLVLDLGLPGMDGASVLERLRQRGTAIPVLVITARDALEERVRVLDLGADDCLVKPFALAELDARVRALVRRSVARGARELQLGHLGLDLPGRCARVHGRLLDLTRREFGLLAALVARLDRTTSRAQLIESVCSWDDELTDNGLDVALHRLRRKLQGSGVTLRTARGLGYLLQVEADA